jgi:glyoxylase-like metal-dependent hydrolase (beta-lactamase superfamily II)
MFRRSTLTAVAAASITLFSSFSLAQLPQPDGGNIERGTLPDHWYSQMPKCMEIPDWQVHEYNKDFYILSQSPCTDYEKPFIFLIFGKDKAMLVDTGSRNGNLAPSLQWVIKNWLTRNSRTSIPLIVTHTHEHGDHTFGDKALQAMNDPAIPVTFIPSEVEATKRFFGIATWPTDIGHVDLGNRMIDIIPIPGHSKVSIAFYDHNTGILLAGDTVYPGRIYVSDFPGFQASLDRLVQFTDGKLVAHILGNHIEQSSTPFLDYPVGTRYQPNEHELALSRGTLLELQAAVASMHGTPRRYVMRDISVWPSGRAFAVPGEREAAEKHEKDETENMWDHTVKK